MSHLNSVLLYNLLLFITTQSYPLLQVGQFSLILRKFYIQISYPSTSTGTMLDNPAFFAGFLIQPLHGILKYLSRKKMYLLCGNAAPQALKVLLVRD